MEKVVIDSDGRVKVDAVSAELAVTDASGKTLAYVLPPAVYRRVMEGREPTAEELEAARKEYREQGGLSTAEAIEFVRTGGRPGGGGT
ncbi:MAG: hypothetical protein C0501_04115 [Isosphaera sp.]|nr:hypothetical protein [Isosphaera sp.]